MRRKTLVIAAVAIASLLMLSSICFLFLTRPIKASPESIMLNSGDLPDGWNITGTTVRWVDGNTTSADLGWTWRLQMDIIDASNVRSVWLMVTSMNSSVEAQWAYSNWFSVNSDDGFVLEHVGFGEEGSRMKTGEWADYYWRDGNIFVQMQFREGSFTGYQPWMDQVAKVLDDKIGRV